MKLIAISQLIKELISKEQYEEALLLCTDDYCKQNVVIAGQRRNIESKIKNLKELNVYKELINFDYVSKIEEEESYNNETYFDFDLVLEEVCWRRLAL